MAIIEPVLAGLAWDPGIRGVLTVVAAVGILCGTVYLVLATNTGIRLGFLVTLTALAGWIALLGLLWMIYGLGLIGRAPSWEVEEINYGNLLAAQTEEARTLPQPEELPDVEQILEDRPDLAEQFPEGTRQPTIADLVELDPSVREEYDIDLQGWRLLPASDTQSGEAQASASAFLVDQRQAFTSTDQFVVLETYDRGGKDQSPAADCNMDLTFWDTHWSDCFERAWHKIRSSAQLFHPIHYAVVQVQPAIPQPTLPGQPPPTPVADEGAPVISVIMTRDLGEKRLPAFGLTLFSGVVFGIGAHALHRRDRFVAEVASQPPVPATRED